MHVQPRMIQRYSRTVLQLQPKDISRSGRTTTHTRKHIFSKCSNHLRGGGGARTQLEAATFIIDFDVLDVHAWPWSEEEGVGGGWHLGKVVNFHGADNAPRLMHRYNYTVLFNDSSRDLMMLGKGYGQEKETPPNVNTCVLLNAK